MSTTGVDFTAPASLPTAKQPKRPARRIGEKSRRGFAAMSPEQQRRIASEGGRASHESGRGHRFSSEEARAAGRKGGQISRRGPSKPGSDAA
ncbi:KGG domain-containing protein [Hymenobacter baengnokdamensis]|uniref:KGG domain-containing protein n=1 Tax=Hymenobacter baengnokdamensis TaxID=2615203 RepID=UPI00124594DB|nr:KGG domain-containing protein [Hymenobacter baengnokdamensis]